ncbi:septum formation initiator family protein [Cryobacterium adonitolivorans]|uniref:Septum formation initiator family protein n=1 Tax=Cryobacterium adonitolivorans TaxID=1259189 RepID=A0A4R8WG65_9MICO|nr:septum formation initiator family protein [Cryobacterium adonitolivorans]TFC05935.1 septum formation initiator family protein [Cryobacterium adonitolivorans]
MTFTGSGMTPPRLPKPHRSQARGVEPRPTEQRAVKLAIDETAVRSWLRGLRLSGFSFVMMGLLVLAVVVLAPSVRTYAEQRKQIDQLSNTVAAQQDSVDDLKAERERWNDRTFVTTQARDRLSYVMPGDISFLVINDTGASVDGAADTAPISTAIQDTDVDWVDSVFRSVMTSALAPQEAAQ